MAKHRSKKFARASIRRFLVISLVFTMALELNFGGTYVSAATAEPSLVDLKGIKVVETYSKFTAPDTIVTDYIPTPRELDEYHRMGIYGKADVPYDISELRLEDADALTSFPSAGTKDKALAMAISDEVYDGLMKGQGVFFTGGDCDTAVGMAGGIRHAYPDAKIGLVYIDSHGDINTLAPIMGTAKDPNMSDCWDLYSVNNDVFDAVLFTDGRDLDPQESDNLDLVSASALNCTMLNTDEFNDEDTWRDAVEAFADDVDVIYLHIDAEFLDQAYIPHMKAGDGPGPNFWTMLDNLKTVMDTGKVAAINLASMYSKDADTGLESRGFKIPEFADENNAEKVNRVAQISILSAIRMISTMFGNWANMPEVPGAVLEIPDELSAKDGDLEGLKVIELLTRPQTRRLIVGRNRVANGEYTYEQRGEVIRERDTLVSDHMGPPRELDDYILAGIYDKARVPWDLSKLSMTEDQADSEYPDMARFEALCIPISNEVNDGLKAGKGIILDGEGCIQAVGVAGGMRRAFGDDAKLGLIYIDAHGDINTVDSTFSGGIGVMDVAPIMGIDPHPLMTSWWNSSSNNGKVFDDLFHCVARNLDSGTDTHDPDNPYEFGEMINMKAATSKDDFIVDVDEFNDATTFDSALADYVSGVDAIYLHIDLDAVDAAFYANGGSPEGSYDGFPGPSIWKLMRNVEAIMATGKVSVVNLASVYGGYDNDPVRLESMGYVFPEVAGEDTDSAESKNRADQISILSGMRVLSTALDNWKSAPMPSSSGGSTNSHSGSGGSGGNAIATQTPPTPKTVVNGDTMTSTTTLTGTQDAATGKIVATVTNEIFTPMIQNAKTAETSGQKSIVEIKVDSASTAKEVVVDIPKAALDKLADETNAQVSVNSSLGKVTFDEKAVQAINEAAGNNIQISIAKVDNAGLSSENQARVGNAPVYDFTVKSGTSKISEFGGGSASVNVPYTLKEGENPNSVVVYYINDSGALETVRGSYDPHTKTVNFITDHFSRYAIGYHEVSFNDVADAAWYKDAVDFIAAREITTGTDGNNFSPKAKLTRAQFLVMVMKAYGIEPAQNSANNFTDAGSTYYTAYLAKAMELGITNGDGNNLFHPKDDISRQDMFTLLYRTLDIIGETPESTSGKALADFSDAGSIKTYARTPMEAFVAAGVVTGNNHKLAPQSTSTRAEMAQVLFNLLSK